MKRAMVLVCAAVLAAPLAFAQQPPREGVARLKDVKGNVLLSRESGLTAGAEAMRLLERTRVITTANSEATVVYDNGCEVKLKENQRFEVETNRACAALVAMPQSIIMTPAGASLAGASVGVILGSAVPAIGGAAIGVGILTDDRRKTPLSPN